MGATTQLARKTDVQHTHGIAVFFAKERHRATFNRIVVRHHLRLGSIICQYLGIDQGFDLRNIRLRNRRIMGKVKTGFIRIHQRAALLHMRPKHLPQGFMH